MASHTTIVLPHVYCSQWCYEALNADLIDREINHRQHLLKCVTGQRDHGGLAPTTANLYEDVLKGEISILIARKWQLHLERGSAVVVGGDRSR